MEEIKIVDNYMNKFEFRNYVYTMFYKLKYDPITLDDIRISDDDKENDNDLIVTKKKIKYTVQTYLNGKINEKNIEGTLKDMKKEKLSHGIIVTNYNVNPDIKQKAKEKNIIILDREVFENGIYD